MRAVYCYTPRRRLKSRDPPLIEDEPPEASLADFQALARTAPLGDGGRVLVGFANDAVHGPSASLHALYSELRDPSRGRAHLITTHAVGGPMYPAGARTVVETLATAAVLGPDVLLSHCNCPHADDGRLLCHTGAKLSCTPGTELHNGYVRDTDHRAAASLGVDCHSWANSAGIPEQMRLLLQAARSARGVAAQERGMWNLRIGFAAEDVFNLGTVGGARACGLEGQVGRLREGYKAEIVVFDGETPGMLAAAAEDPVGAVVLYSTPADIEMVFIDGVVRKEGGKLLGVTVAPAPNESMCAVKPGTKLGWKEVVTKVLESRKSLKQKAEGIDFDKAEQVCMNLFHMNAEAILEAQ
jgi:cytosine/adenosine deaminase-related metal-dependent hydrolase